MTTPSGNTAYRCIGDLLFGDGIPEVLNLRNVTFTGEISSPPIPSCHVRATPGPNGRAAINYHMED